MGRRSSSALSPSTLRGLAPCGTNLRSASRFDRTTVQESFRTAKGTPRRGAGRQGAPRGAGEATTPACLTLKTTREHLGPEDGRSTERNGHDSCFCPPHRSAAGVAANGEGAAPRCSPVSMVRGGRPTARGAPPANGRGPDHRAERGAG